MKKILLCILFVGISNLYAQKGNSLKLGKTTKEELALTIYEKDSTANALVLEEEANLYVDENRKYKFRADYYKRVKFFNKKNEDKATINISLYKNDNVEAIKAVTYTLKGDKIKEIYLLDNQIFTKQINEFWKEVSFTLPNISKGCVIEYTYSLIHNSSGIDDWYFQSDIPKLKSKYKATIPGNWRYNSKLVGYQKFDTQDSYIKKSCLYVEGIVKPADCVVSEYGMKDIPAFKEEDYMLAKKNFISRLAFELESFMGSDGVEVKYTETWKDADKTFKNNFLDKQTSKKNYFKNNLPESLFLIENPLKKAKKTFYHIQERMYWNGGYWTNKNLKVKKAYEEKKGSVDAINLGLYNSLQALGIESYMAILSTRDNGVPSRLYPAVEDFNYVVVKVVIEGETFFLDATDKYLSFGEVPLRCLNGDARILDFKKGSYWELIKPRFKTSIRSQVKLGFDEQKQLVGELIVSKTGYFGLEERKKVNTESTDEYLDGFETDHPNIEVESVVTEGTENEDASIKNKYTIKVDITETSDVIKFNPFIYGKKTKNPFKLKERIYPVDYGYPRNTTQLINFKIPKGYIIKSLPQKVGVSLPNKGGKYIMNILKGSGENEVSIIMKYSINKKVYSNEEYYYLKEFYNKIIKSQEQLIILEKEK